MATSLAIVDRFCAIEGKHCEKLVPYRGTNSYFFA